MIKARKGDMIAWFANHRFANIAHERGTDAAFISLADYAVNTKTNEIIKNRCAYVEDMVDAYLHVYKKEFV